MEKENAGKSPLVVGVVTKSTQQRLEKMLSASPIRMISSPLLILSAPDEFVSAKTIDYLRGTDDVIKVIPYDGRFVYNPYTNQSECIIGVKSMAAMRMSLDQMRRNLLGISGKADFIPYFVLAYDPMQSRSAKSYVNSSINSLRGEVLEFELTVAGPESFVYKAYNEYAQIELAATAYLAEYVGN
jgi:hypothetical protein